MTYLHDYPFLYAAVGTHPHDAEEMKDEDLARFEEMAQDDKVKAVGEIGLDYFYDLSPRDVQKKRLRDQLALAENLRLPVIIHDREAHEDTPVASLIVERQNSSVCHIGVQLGYYLEGGMHGEHGYARVNSLNIALGHEHRDCAAAALIDLTELSHLPDDFIRFKQRAHFADKLSIRVV